MLSKVWVLGNKTCPLEIQGCEKNRKNLWMIIINKPDRRQQYFLQLITSQKYNYALQTQINIAVRKSLSLFYLHDILKRVMQPPFQRSGRAPAACLGCRRCPNLALPLSRGSDLWHLPRYHTWVTPGLVTTQWGQLKGWADMLEKTRKLVTSGMLQFPLVWEMGSYCITYQLMSIWAMPKNP